MDYTFIILPILAILILILLMVLMAYLYLKIGIWYAILVVFLFSVVIGSMSISLENIPFTPYFQLFFIVFQLIFFLLNSIEVFFKK